MEHEKKTPLGIVCLLTLTIGFSWGLSFLAINIILDELDPYQLLAVRWLIAAAVFGVLVLTGKVKVDLRKKSAPVLLLSGLVLPCLYSIFEAFGVEGTSTSISSLFIATIPCANLLISSVIFHRRPGKLAILGVAVAFLGVVFASVLGGGSIEGTVFGYVMLTFAVVCGGLYSPLTKRATEEYSSLEITCTMSFLAFVFYTILHFAKGYGFATYSAVLHNPKILLLLLFLGVICSCVCYLCNNQLITYLEPAVQGNLTASLTTVVGVLAGVLIAGDPAGWNTWIGLALTILGVILSSLSIDRK